MNVTELAHLQWSVLGLTALVSIFFGALLHRSHFCTMGAVSDAVVMENFDRLRQWALALVVAIFGFACMSYAGLINPLQSVYAAKDFLWLSALLGGLLFGWGMVWASGCGSKTLVRLGAGNLKSLFVLIVMGVVALSAMKGVLAVGRVTYIDSVKIEMTHGLFAGEWLSHYFNVSLQAGVLFAACFASALLLLWVLKDKNFLTLHNLSTGILVGLVICVVWLLSGVLGHGMEHPETLEEFFLATSSRKMEALSFTGPVALGLDALMYFSDGTKRLTIGLVSVLGVCAGSFLSAWFQGSLKLEGFSSAADMRRHLLGACLMGVGAVLAMGCSIGQGLSGLSTLSLTSLIASLSILAGAFAALQFDLRQAD
jgi:uncharacterized membrane protein YedE/YeeE